jgi:hypothetical protein
VSLLQLGVREFCAPEVAKALLCLLRLEQEFLDKASRVADSER